MSKVQSIERRPPPPPPPPPPKKVEIAASKPKVVDKAEAAAAKKLEEDKKPQVLNQSVLPPPGPAAQTRGDQVRDRLQKAGVVMKPRLHKTPIVKASDPSAPFSGSGATGDNINSGSVPLVDQAALAANRIAEKLVPSQGLANASNWAMESSLSVFDTSEKLATSIETNSAELARRMQAFPGGDIPGRLIKGAGDGLSSLTRGVGYAASDGLGHLSHGLSVATDVAEFVKYGTAGQTRQDYSNPVVDPDAYLAKLSPADRTQQVRALLDRPINTLYPEAYGNSRPTRGDVVAAAAKKHNLDPNVLSGFLLAEQRDQSRKEDLKDLGAATSLFKANTSIGLGQMTVATSLANNGEMFSDTLDARTRSRLTHSEAAKLLTSDEHAIFAAARYIRKTADDGTRMPDAKLVETLNAYPGLRKGDLRGSSWNDDQIRALGSEYTSKPWDDELSEGWGEFVLQSTQDVRRSGRFASGRPR